MHHKNPIIQRYCLGMTSTKPPSPFQRFLVWSNDKIRRFLIGWRRFQRLPLLMILTSFLAALGMIQTSFQIGHMIYRSVIWNAENAVAQKNIRELERDIANLKAAQTSLNDSVYMSELARCQGFVGADEAVIIDPQAPKTQGDNCAAIRFP